MKNLITVITDKVSEWNEGGKAVMIPMILAEVTAAVGVPYGAYKVGEIIVQRVAQLIQ